MAEVYQETPPASDEVGEAFTQIVAMDLTEKRRIIEKETLVTEHLGAIFEVHSQVHYFTPYSLFCLTNKHQVRRWAVWIVTWKWFDHFITIVILVNSVILAMHDYEGRLVGPSYHSEKNHVLDEMGKVLSVIFICECVLKIIAMGFVFHKTSYLRDTWNKLDFFVVCASFLDWELFPQLNQFSSLKVLRTFRILRPLRSINKVKRLKLLINSLLKSLPGLCNVMIFLFFIMSIFGIFATHQFKGAQYQRCRTSEKQQFLDAAKLSPQTYWPKQEKAEWLCRNDAMCKVDLKDDASVNGVYVCGTPLMVGLNYTDDLANRDELIMFDIVNFNSFPEAMRSIFIAISLEGWILMLYNYSDANQPFLSAVFFIFLVIFGAFFALNLVLAEVINSYYASKKEELLKIEMAQADKELQQRLEEAKEYIDKQKDENRAIEVMNLDADLPIQEEEGNNKLPLISVRANSSQAMVIESAQREQESQLEGPPPLSPNKKVHSKEEKKEDLEKIQEVTLQKLSSEEEEEENQEELCELNARARAANNKCLGFFYLVVTASLFNFIIFILIIINTAVLAYDGYPISHQEYETLHFLNECMTFIFFGEMLLKLVGLGLSNYFKDNFNVFDCVVVIVSLIDFVIIVTVDESEIGSAADGLHALRALRLLRIIKLARSWTELQEILRKTAMSLKDIGYFSVLLFLFMFIISLLGMELFANECRFDEDNQLIANVKKAYKNKEVMLAPRNNFDSISTALITVFIIILGEDWPGVMYNYVRVYDMGEGNSRAGWAISMFFIFCYSVGNFLLLSLFVAILLENFEEKKEDGDFDEEEDPEQKFKSMTDSAYDSQNISSISAPKKSPRQWAIYFMIEFQYQYVFAFGTRMAITRAAAIRDAKRKAFEEELNKEREPLPEKIQFEFISDAFQLQDALDQAAKNARSNEKKASTVIQWMGTSERTKRAQSGLLENDEQGPQEKNWASCLGSPFAEPYEAAENPDSISRLQQQQKIASSLAHLELHMANVTKVNKIEAKRKMRGKSLFMFGKENAMRKFCYNVVNFRGFDWTILIFICISTVNLAIESPLDDPESQKMFILHTIDNVMTGIFIHEALLKVIAYGFLFNGKESYLRDYWCILDFFIVLISVLGIIFKEYNLTYLKVLRMLRVMKPLRMLTMMRSLRVAIVSLFKSIPAILNLLLILTFFIFMLSILSMTLFKGKFYSCHTKQLKLDPHDQLLLILTKEDCLNYGGEWTNRDLNFDTTSQAFVTLFTVQSTEGWIDVMWNSVDAVGPDMQPILGYRTIYILYYIILIVLLCMLFLNLFVGVVCETFNKESENLSFNHLLGEDTKNWIQVQLMSYSAKPKVRLIENQPQVSWLRNFCIKVTNNPAFDNVIVVCILLNTVALAIVWYQMSEELVHFFEYLNYVFMGIFTVEAAIKLVAHQAAYFKDTWNIFDFVVVVGSLIALGLSLMPELGIDLAAQSTMVRILRVLRVLRIIKRAEKLQIIAETLLAAAPAMGSLGLLLLLLQFMYGIIGMQLFAMIKLEGDLNKHANFQYFTNAFLLLMRCATGEGWNALMFDTGRTNSITFQCDAHPTYTSYKENNFTPNGCGMPRVATIYYISFQIIVSQVFLNLFIAIVVDTFIAMKNAYDLPIRQTDIEVFTEIWQKYDVLGTGYIKCKDLSNLILDLYESDTSFFSDDPEQILNPMCRLNMMIYLEIPLHKGLQCFMFYEVLSIICRYECETSHKLIQKRRKEIKQIIEISQTFKGTEQTQEYAKHCLNLRMRQDDQCRTLFEHMFVTNQVDKRVELKIDLDNAAKAVAKKYTTTMDYHSGEGISPDKLEIYTSKHMYNAEKIVYYWRRRKERNISKDSSEHLDETPVVYRNDSDAIIIAPSLDPDNVRNSQMLPKPQDQAGGQQLQRLQNSSDQMDWQVSSSEDFSEQGKKSIKKQPR